MAETNESKPKTKLVEIEDRVMAFWEKEQIFQKTLNKGGKEFVFYDGPPFATGLPHFGHLLPTTIKDVFPRYKTMRGYHVPRRWGWDCHGLPVENLIEKELGLKTKKDILEYGIGKFNAAAEESVLRYAKEWKHIIPRIGRWVDMQNDYRTMDASYTQSVWWAFKTLCDKGLVYEGFKTMQICPRCETSLSNFEVNQGYKDITDISVYVRLELKKEPGTYFLAWTTTPWTLPGNVALAVGSDIDYVTVEFEGKKYILAKDRVADVFAGKNHTAGETMKGGVLVGKEYGPIFDYYNASTTKNIANAFKVYAADFVTTTDGTGIVHIAPAFGEDDMKLGDKYKLPFIQHVGMNGKFKREVLAFPGHDVKPKSAEKDGHQKTDIEVIKWLAHNGFLFEKKKIIHSYPHCWRCDTPLLNYATSSWFVRVTSFKDKLVAENKQVNWTPDDIRDGRFGKWLEGARDWAISRSRFWGAPIPVWKDEKGKLYPIGTLEELSKIIKRSGNSYTLVRHGESEANVLGISNSEILDKYHLTAKGREEARANAERLAKTGVDIIIASDFLRTKETARIIADACGIPQSHIVYDQRLREFKVGPEREGKSWADTDRYVRTQAYFPGMETADDLKRRVFNAMYDIDKRYSGKKIAIISHGAILNTIAHNIFDTPSPDKILHDERRYFRLPGEMRSFDFIPLPHNEHYNLDLHRPHIDNIECVGPKGEKLTRVEEVFDCWFESGSMPYAEEAYQGKALKSFNPKGGLFKKLEGYPADFISEGLDQTRGWFYTLSVLGTALFGKIPFKNVVVNGLILAEDGTKMSKSKNNYPPLMPTVEKYGADSLRYFLASSPAVKAEDVRFSEKGVDEVSKKLLQRLDNVLAFYEMYAKDGHRVDARESNNVLDVWIMARLSETLDEVTKNLDLYLLDKAARPLMSFVDDLSTWYLRRSRDRFKSDDASDRKFALATTRLVLNQFSKIMAPFTPFYAEYLYGRTKGQTDPQSVHLCEWPKPEQRDSKVIKTMAETRRLVTLALEQRAKANIKVRQPLSKLTLKAKDLGADFVALIKDEVNVKEVAFNESQEGEVVLDVAVTEELRKEGVARDLIRAIQDLRKTEGLTVGDRVALILDSDEKAKELVHAYLSDIKRVTLVSGVEYDHLPHAAELKIEEYTFKLGFKR
jgi:isoleucyl-tRNA synthetase